MQQDEPPKFATKMLSELSFIIAITASIILDRKRSRKKEQRKQKNMQKKKYNPRSQDADLHWTNVIA